MSSRLYFSNSLDALVDRLIEGLRGGDPFKAPIIATPSPALRGWLQVRVAERLGIAANIDFLNLERLLWNRLAQLDHFRNVSERQPAKILDAMNFQGLVLTWLQKNPPAALQHYLHPEDGEPHDEARRLCQLAGKLAALFREYEYSRVTEGGFKGLTETWNKGETCFEQYLQGSKLSPGQREQIRILESWQREIYQGLFCDHGLRDNWGEATGVYRYTLPQYAEMVLNQERKPDETNGESPVFHLFGLSHISPFHRALIYRLADSAFWGANVSRFEIYALNPCAEYWEDATSRPRLTRDELQSELQGEELPDAENENALLNRFGKPGRETIKLWNQITDYDSEENFQEVDGDSLLAAVQRAILHRSGPLSTTERKAQDTSLQIWSAPDRYAEVEAVKSHIGELLLSNPALKLEDIAVIPASLETYLPVIETLFEGRNEAGYVPFCLPEAGMLRESDLLRGFRELIELGSGPFRRGDLLAWLENSAVQKKLRLNRSDVFAFGKILDDSGFQEGWDEAHREAQEAVAGSLSTAEAAIERSLLGLILDPSEIDLENAGLHPAATAMAWDREELSQCLDLLGNLKTGLRAFHSGEKLTFSEWGKCLRSLLENYFQADAEEPLEIQAEKDLLRFCADLEQWSSGSCSDDSDESKISHHAVAVLIDDHFKEPRAARMPFLTGGVRIGSLIALRSLPFQHVYLLGFNAGDFPSSRDISPLDLRGYRRVIGEADPASRDLYAFLEMISSTSTQLVLSYVRRDALRDSVRQPSQALAGLIAYLESDILSDDNGKPRSFEVLELNAEGRYSSEVSSEVDSEDCEDSEKWQPPARPRFERLRLKALSTLNESDAVALVKARVPLPPSPKWAELPKEENPVLDLQSLALYLQNPLEHAAFNHFRFYNTWDDEDDEAPALFLDRWESGKFLDPALRAELLHPGEGEAAAHVALQRQIWSGKGASQPYAKLEMERIEKEARDLIEGSIQELREAADALGLVFAGTLRLGGQGTRPLDPPILDKPAFDAAVIGISAKVAGTLPYFFTGRNSGLGWALLLNTESDRDWIVAYLFQLCVAALDSQKNFSGPAYVLFQKSGEIFRLPEFDAGQAAQDLQSFLRDAMRAPDFNHLPLKVIEKLAGKSDSEARQKGFAWKEHLEEREREDAENAFSAAGKRARILRALGPEIPVDAGLKIERRLFPFLNWRERWEKIE